MRELLYGFQVSGWLLSLVFGAQYAFADEHRVADQALFYLPYAAGFAGVMFLATFAYERMKHLEEAEVQLDRLKKKHPQLFHRVEKEAL